MSSPPLTVELTRYLRHRGRPSLPLAMAWLHDLAVALDAGALAPRPDQVVLGPGRARAVARPTGGDGPGRVAAIAALARLLLTGRHDADDSVERRLGVGELRPGLPPEVDDVLAAPWPTAQAVHRALAALVFRGCHHEG